MLNLNLIPAFQDNYIWALDDGQHCLVVDPGDSEPVEAFLAARQLTLTTLLITHHHPDHVGGIMALKSTRPELQVFGPKSENIPGRTVALGGAETIQTSAPILDIEVIAVPGHTLGHIAYFLGLASEPILFCGDTLFSGGCGRLFEGTAEQMLLSLDRLAQLPGHTRVCCAHEYTEANMSFAKAVLPDDEAVNKRYKEVTEMRQAERPTLPVSIAQERASNVFLRIDDPELQASLRHHQPGLGAERHALFASLRSWKDNFRG
jgi:hydroxyacylglutathione hydrolase